MTDIIKSNDVRKYTELLDDLQTILTERVFRMRMEVIEMKHELGKRILEDELYSKRAEYGKQIVEKLAIDLKVSRTDLYLCIEFATKYPELSKCLDNLPEGKNLSWNKIVQNYLPQEQEEKLEKKLRTQKTLKAELMLLLQDFFQEKGIDITIEVLDGLAIKVSEFYEKKKEREGE